MILVLRLLPMAVSDARPRIRGSNRLVKTKGGWPWAALRARHRLGASDRGEEAIGGGEAFAIALKTAIGTGGSPGMQPGAA